MGSRYVSGGTNDAGIKDFLNIVSSSPNFSSPLSTSKDVGGDYFSRGANVPVFNNNTPTLNPTLNPIIPQNNSFTSRKEAIKKFAGSPIGASILTMIIVLLILIVIQPPLVKSHINSKEEAKLNWWYVVAWVAFSGLVVFIYPFVASAIRKRMEAKKLLMNNDEEGFEFEKDIDM